jgi:hypothetical protein
MDDPRTEIEQKERLLTELEARLQALGRIKKELSAQAQILRHQLLELRKSGHAGGPGHKERRTTSRRHGNLVSVTITREPSRVASPEARAMDGWVMNRSGGGLCLLVDDEVAPGMVLTVTPHLGPTAYEWIQVEVKSCRPEKKELAVGLPVLAKTVMG